MGSRTCSKCLRGANETAFYKKGSYCKPCQKAYNVEWAKRNPAAVQAYRDKWQWVNHIKFRYGLTVLQYQQMAARQDFKCAICEQDDETLLVDHSHDTKQVRGLLCQDCNQGIGRFKDSSNNMHRAIEYVRLNS